MEFVTSSLKCFRNRSVNTYCFSHIFLWPEVSFRPEIQFKDEGHWSVSPIFQLLYWCPLLQSGSPPKIWPLHWKYGWSLALCMYKNLKQESRKHRKNFQWSTYNLLVPTLMNGTIEHYFHLNTVEINCQCSRINFCNKYHSRLYHGAFCTLILVNTLIYDTELLRIIVSKWEFVYQKSIKLSDC
jgi:hypothetical protein